MENYRNLAFLLEFLANSENTTEHTRNKVFTEAFRFLRNSVAGSKLNQDAVTDGSKILTVTVIFFQCQVEDRNENDIRADVEKDNLHIRCALQFLANCMAGNPRNSTVISEQFSELLYDGKNTKLHTITTLFHFYLHLIDIIIQDSFD